MNADPENVPLNGASRRCWPPWQKDYHLAPEGPAFSADYLLKMSQHLH